MRSRIEGGVVRGLAALPHPLLQMLVGRPVVVDRQRLHVEVQLALKLLALAGEPSLDELSAADARAQVAADARKFRGPQIEVARVEELTIPGPAGPIGARLYVPERYGRDAGTPGGLLVFFHGGGFVVCDLETHDNVCRFLARQAGVSVMAVDYRLAPEHRFPAAIDDAQAAFRFAVEHAAELGSDPARVAVGGDSAGGNLAAGVARLAAVDGGSAPAFQLLFYPWLDLAGKHASYGLFGDGFYLTEADLDWYKRHYVGDEHDALDPRCSPLAAEDVAGVAPAYIVTAGFDPLRDEGEEYAERLRGAGVRVAVRRQAGMIHGFINTVQIGHAAREALLEAAGALRVGLAG
jgi:acetyl esterase